MNSASIVQLVAALQRGAWSADEAAGWLSSLSGGVGPCESLNVGDVQVDLGRQERCGFPEVVFAPGKATEAIIRVFEAQCEAGQECYATRVSAEQAAGLLQRFPDAKHNAVARTVRLSPTGTEPPRLDSLVTVVTAGTSDRPIAEEAMETLRWMGARVELVVDVGVAGPHRLLEKLHHFTECDVVVVVAGMEGALPSVVGGWVDCPIIAVPTSVGYGASLGGLTALLGMLNSCASNVTVVNIDAGFKAGYVAGMIARQCTKARARG